MPFTKIRILKFKTNLFKIKYSEGYFNKDFLTNRLQRKKKWSINCFKYGAEQAASYADTTLSELIKKRLVLMLKFIIKN